MTAGAAQRARPQLTPGTAGVLAAIALLQVLWSHTGDRQLLAALGALAGTLPVDAVWAAVAIHRVSVAVLIAPRDATAGDTVPITVQLGGAAAPIEVRVPTAAQPAVYLLDPPAVAAMECTLATRDVLDALPVRVRVTGPLGLFGFTRSFTCPLRQSLAVGPRPRPPTETHFPRPQAASGSAREVRAIRPYVVGDPMRYVHWPAVARSGRLAVREFEPPVAERLQVVLDAGDRHGHPYAELAVGRAAWICNEALRRGFEVTLSTVESGRTRTEAVRSSADAGRRLAAAGPGRPALGRTGGPTVRVSTAGDRWSS